MTPRVVFIGHGGSRSSWYRCVLPAMYGGHDWAGVVGDPPALRLAAGFVGGETREPDLREYDVVVLQQVRGRKWFGLIRDLQSRGIKVLYEIDDYVHELKNATDHDFSYFFKDHHLKEMELCMRQCDGMIFSTTFLAQAYQKFARRSWVCENGLDLGRYRLTRPERGQVAGRETTSVMWAGATGHLNASIPWLGAVSLVMDRNPHVTFVTVGADMASALSREFPDRTLSIPFTALETYTSAMMAGDIAIAPAGDSKWYKAKSDLRVMEAQALGIPVVADRHYEKSVVDGETGYVVGRPERALSRIEALLDDELRERMSEAAREYAHERFSMSTRVSQWSIAFDELLSEK